MGQLADRPDVRVALDRAANILRDANDRVQPVCVGLVGESQVGKSSLMNALLGRMALPAGGIGPLTAQAIRVSWGEEETMHVSYHGGRRLNQLRFAIEQYLGRVGVLSTAAPSSANEPPPPEGEETRVLDELIAEEGDGERDERRAAKPPPRIEFYLAQARRLLCEKTDTQPDAVDLVNGLRRCLKCTRAGSGKCPHTGSPGWRR